MKGVLANGSNVAMEALSEDILNIVLAESIVNREVAVSRISAILRAYVRRNTAYPTVKNSDDLDKISKKVQRHFIEQDFWKVECKYKYSDEEMNLRYKELDNILYKYGLIDNPRK